MAKSKSTNPGSGATDQRILGAALESFGIKGYDQTSLDSLASSLGLTKQSILYWFSSKDELLAATIDMGARQLTEALQYQLSLPTEGWDRVEAVVKVIFRLAARRPELIGLVREVTRLGPPATTRMAEALEPLLKRASGFFELEMAAGRMRRHEPKLLLMTAYSAVTGMASDVEVLKALGEQQDARSFVRRRNELLRLLRDALVSERLEDR